MTALAALNSQAEEAGQQLEAEQLKAGQETLAEQPGSTG